MPQCVLFFLVVVLGVAGAAPFEGGEDVSGSSGVQARSGLVHEQQGGLGHQLQPNVHPLTLPTTAKTHTAAVCTCSMLDGLRC